MESLTNAAQSFDISTNVELDQAGSPVLDADAEETVSSSCDDVQFLLSDMDFGKGKLVITTRRVLWIGTPSQEGQRLSLALDYHLIMMHAISKDASVNPKPCLYFQLDDGSEDMMGGEEEEEEEEDELAGLSAEVRLVPDDSDQVEPLFKALCDCAALNPDPDNEGEGDFFFNEDEVINGLDADSRAALMANRMQDGMALGADQELDELMGEDPDRFNDEDEEYEEGEEGGVENGH